MTYAEKLGDPRWQKKRLEIMKRDEFTCQKCGCKRRTLHVHHKEYNGNDPWDYEDDKLIVLCNKCHENIDKKREIFTERQAWKYMESNTSEYDLFEYNEDEANKVWGWDHTRSLDFLFQLYTSKSINIIHENIGCCLIKLIKKPNRLK